MADAEKRFEVTISFSAKEVKDGQVVDHHDLALSYHDMPYDFLVATQQEMLKTLTALGDMGIGRAALLGYGERLAIMGFGPKLAALAKAYPTAGLDKI